MKLQVRQKIVDGELNHVLVVGGQEFQRFTCLKAALAALVMAMACSGCATIEKHPVATSIVGSVLVTSLALSSHHGGGGHGPQMSEPLIAAPEVDCSKVSCK